LIATGMKALFGTGIEPLQAARTLRLATHPSRGVGQDALALDAQNASAASSRPVARPNELFMRPVG